MFIISILFKSTHTYKNHGYYYGGYLCEENHFKAVIRAANRTENYRFAYNKYLKNHCRSRHRGSDTFADFSGLDLLAVYQPMTAYHKNELFYEKRDVYEQKGNDRAFRIARLL